MKTKLSNIADIRTGVFAKTDIKGDLAYIQPKYFDQHGDLDTSLRLDINLDTISDNHLLQNGDVLFAAKGTKNFATCYHKVKLPAAASTSFFVIRPHSNKYLPEYLAWFLNHASTMRYLKAKAKGSSIVSIAKTVLSDLEIPVPEIKTQKLILRIDQLRKSENDIKKRIDELNERAIQHQIFNAIENEN